MENIKQHDHRTTRRPDCVTEIRMGNIKGHRTVGGMRASIYNAMPYEGVEALVSRARGTRGCAPECSARSRRC